MKKLILSQIHNPNYSKLPAENLDDPDLWVYVVEKVTNSITPTIGWPNLSAQQASSYCHDDEWDVTITLPK